MEIWELELQQIERETSPEAMLDAWSEVLAGLGGVSDADFERLALKAHAILAEKPDELTEAVADRLDEMYHERRVLVV